MTPHATRLSKQAPNSKVTQKRLQTSYEVADFISLLA
jgi:hypothetical protein